MGQPTCPAQKCHNKYAYVTTITVLLLHLYVITY